MNFDRFCQMPEPYHVTKLPSEFVIEEKVRGRRCIFKKEGFFTWGQKRLPVVNAIVDSANTVRKTFGQLTMLDGVFVLDAVVDEDGSKRATGNFHIFEAVRGKSFSESVKGDSYYRRKKELKDIILRSIKPGLMLLDSIPLIEMSHEAVLSGAQKIWKRGGEGIIIKDRNAFYQHGPSSKWLKLTREEAACAQC